MMKNGWIEQNQGHPGGLAMKAAHVPLNQMLADQTKSKGSQHHQVDETTWEIKVLSGQHMTSDAGTHA